MLFNQGCILLPSLALSPYWTRLHHGWVRLDQPGQVASSMEHPSFSPGTMVATSVLHGLSHMDMSTVQHCTAAVLTPASSMAALALAALRPHPHGLRQSKAPGTSKHGIPPSGHPPLPALACLPGPSTNRAFGYRHSSLLGSAYPQCTNIFSQRTAGGATRVPGAPDHCLKFSVQSTSRKGFSDLCWFRSERDDYVCGEMLSIETREVASSVPGSGSPRQVHN